MEKGKKEEGKANDSDRVGKERGLERKKVQTIPRGCSTSSSRQRDGAGSSRSTRIGQRRFEHEASYKNKNARERVIRLHFDDPADVHTQSDHKQSHRMRAGTSIADLRKCGFVRIAPEKVHAAARKAIKQRLVTTRGSMDQLTTAERLEITDIPAVIQHMGIRSKVKAKFSASATIKGPMAANPSCTRCRITDRLPQRKTARTMVADPAQ